MSKAVCDVFFPWPDVRLRQTFRSLVKIYQRWAEERLTLSLGPPRASQLAYEKLCTVIMHVCAPASACALSEIPQCSDLDRDSVRNHVLTIKERYGQDWLHAMASLLAMLMHLSIDRGNPPVLQNRRRPGKEISTYPTAPVVTRMTVKKILDELSCELVPSGARLSAIGAGKYAARALNFRLIDPSMESGQLLLEVALVLFQRIHDVHDPNSRSAIFLRQEVLERLCRDCIWGIDVNPAAISAVSVAFSLLSWEYGMTPVTPTNLITADSLLWQDENRDLQFDAVANNPPWGEVLEPKLRENIRENYLASDHRIDTYVAFTELGLRLLKKDGLFGFILPAQVLAATNACSLRNLLAESSCLSEITILPRHVFAPACVRAIILSGCRPAFSRASMCRLTNFPFAKSFTHVCPPVISFVPTEKLRSLKGKSWWPLTESAPPQPQDNKITLCDVSTVHLGSQLYAVGRGAPPQTKEIVRQRPFSTEAPEVGALPAARGRDLRRFHVLEPRIYAKFGRWLARPGEQGRIRHRERIFVRELCDRDGKLTAAMPSDGLIALHGVFSILPFAVNAHILTAILNSKFIAGHVRVNASSFTKVDFQRITAEELRKLPIPELSVAPKYRPRLGLRELTIPEMALLKSIRALARAAGKIRTEGQTMPDTLHSTIDSMVFKLYGAADQEPDSR